MTVEDFQDLALFDTTIAVHCEDEDGFHSPSEEEESKEVQSFSIKNDILILDI